MRAHHKHNTGLNPHGPIDKLVCEVPAVCLPLINQYLDDVTKGKPKAARKKIHNVMKAAKRDMICYSCSRSLLIPTDRKECSVCDVISCKKCSNKDLVVYWPRGTDNTRESTQPRIEIMSNVKDISGKADVWRNYRLCDLCKSHLDHSLNEYTFSLDLQALYSKLTSLQSQITTKHDEVSCNPWNRQCSVDLLDSDIRDFEVLVSCNPWNRQCSVDLLDSDIRDFEVLPRNRSYSSDCMYDNNCNEVLEVKDGEILDKLLNQYSNCHIQLANLKPETNKQRTLVKNILSAAEMFYIEKRRQFRVLTASQTSEEQVAS
ncbi:uncharacterized protein LOC121368873 [Gigantopelta aegis]|uniref:uncharacterized protein LOC121368873 n=1 Tax=Gigantopelta aegis TaxID=1735272 RepID=UPI001B88A983|nr:uncharacterized protein LOC121368873 [Gigantopelta aegis]